MTHDKNHKNDEWYDPTDPNNFVPDDISDQNAEIKSNEKPAEPIMIREGDWGENIPEDITEYHTLTPEELRAEEEAKQKRIKREYEEELAKKLDEVHQTNFFNCQVFDGLSKRLMKVFRPLLFLVAAILLLFMIAEITRSYNDIMAIAPPFNLVVLTFAGLCCAVIAWYFFRIVLLGFRLKPNKRREFAALKILRERKEWRGLVDKDREKVKKLLEQYLESFPLDEQQTKTAKNSAFLAHFTSDEILELKRLRNFQNNFYGSTDDWLKEFRNRFQAALDKKANQVVKHYVMNVSVGTALSPKSGVDRLLVIMGAVAMVNDLLAIYLVRPAAGESMLLIAQGIFTAYLGGKIQWATQQATDIFTASGLNDYLKTHSMELFGVNLNLVGGVMKPLTAKAAEALLNSCLIKKLGQNVINQLQPIPSDYD